MKKQVLASALLVFAVASVHPQTQIRFLTYMEGQTRSNLQTVVDGFNRSQSAVRVELEYVPLSGMKDQLKVAVASGNPPDVTLLDNPDTAAQAANGLLVDITDRVASLPGVNQYFPGPWKSTIYQGRQYGLPFTSNCLALFYDPEALAEAGIAVPQTWESLRKAARLLTQQGRYGLAISAVNSEEGTFQFLPWFWSAGADLKRLDSPEGVSALAYLRQLIVEGSMSPNVITWTQTDVQKQFTAGKAALMINGPWNIGPMQTSAPNSKFGIAPIPRDKTAASVLGGENLVLVKGGHTEAAWQFVLYMEAPERLDQYSTVAGYFPPRADVAKINTRWNQDPLLKGFMTQMSYARPRGPHPRWPEISVAISRAVQEALTGALSPQEALSAAEKTVQRIR